MSECPGYQLPDEGQLPKITDINVATATDLEWHLGSGAPHVFCGGCGGEAKDCHPGRCCTEDRDLMGVLANVCGLCKTRADTGQVRMVGEGPTHWIKGGSVAHALIEITPTTRASESIRQVDCDACKAQILAEGIA